MLNNPPTQARIDPQPAPRSQLPRQQRRAPSRDKPVAPSRDGPVRYRQDVSNRPGLLRNVGLGIGVFTLWATLFGFMMSGFGRLDTKIDNVRLELDTKIDNVRLELDTKIDNKIDGLRNELKDDIRDVNRRIDELGEEIRNVNRRLDDLFLLLSEQNETTPAG